MVKLKGFCIILVAIAFFTGCQSSSKPSRNNRCASSSTTQNSTPNNTVVQNRSGNINSTSNINIVIPNTAGIPIKSSSAMRSGNVIYYCNWSDQDKIYQININGAGKKKISDDSAYELILSNNVLYYSNESDSYKLYSINTNGTNRKQLLNSGATNLILLNNFIYYIDSNNIISAFNIANRSFTPFNIKSRCFDSDGKNIYYEDYSSKSVLSSMQVNGSNVSKIYDDIPLSIVSQSGMIYYSNGCDSKKLYKINSNGSGRTKLNDSSSSNLVFDNGWIYYINNSDYDKIYKIKVDGTSNTKVSDDGFVKSFSIAGNYVYFNEKPDVDLNFIHK